MENIIGSSDALAKNKNNVLAVTFLVILHSMSPSIAGASAKESKNMAVVDMRSIESKSLAVVDIKKRLQRGQDIYQTEFAKREGKLRAEAANIQKQQHVASSQSIDQKRKELESGIAKMQSDMRAKKDALDKAGIDGLSQIDAKVRDIVAEIAHKNDYHMVIPSGALLYVDNEKVTDITDSVIDVLNKRLKEVEVNIDDNKLTDSGDIKKSKRSRKR